MLVLRSEIHIAKHDPAPIMSIFEITTWIGVRWVLVRDVRFGRCKRRSLASTSC